MRQRNHGGRSKKLRIACLIRAGKLCSRCKGSCFEEPGVVGPPARVQCVRCNGRGCGLCERRGWTQIRSCPKKLVTDETRDFLRMAAFADDGYLPAAGAVLDQTQSFMTALRFFRDEERSLADK
jgi:hypothetical protein